MLLLLPSLLHASLFHASAASLSSACFPLPCFSCFPLFCCMLHCRMVLLHASLLHASVVKLNLLPPGRVCRSVVTRLAISSSSAPWQRVCSFVSDLFPVVQLFPPLSFPCPPRLPQSPISVVPRCPSMRPDASLCLSLSFAPPAAFRCFLLPAACPRCA